MAVVYLLGDKLYINLTNRCSNDCKFCVRNFKKGVGGYNLWLKKEPTAKEVIAEIKTDDNIYQEFVFCGYGEPLIRLEELIEISRFLKANYQDTPIRVNTNGQGNLIHNKNILPELEEVIDIISISLNAHNSQSYLDICQPKFGAKSFSAVIEFIKEAKNYISKVMVSAVDYPGVDIAACKKLARELEVEFKSRYF